MHAIKSSVSFGMSVKVNVRTLSLVRDKAFVGGKWTAGRHGNDTFDVRNPANGQVVGSVPNLGLDDVDEAVNAASDAFKSWRRTTPKERSNLLRKWYDLLVKNSDALADLVTAEAGKCRPESMGEVNYSNSFVEWFSEEARRIYGEVVDGQARNKQMLFIKEPIGVVGLITPWNFPVGMITRKAAAALAAGCTCVIKPAEDTPLSALALADLADQAGFPKGVINVVTCNRDNAADVGKLLCTHNKVAGISFTGSTAVGKLLYAQCSQGIKRIALELGGNAPFIVFKTANLDQAVEGAMVAKFRNSGQTCVSPNRFLVQREVVNDFVTKLSARLSTLVCGDGSKSGVSMGPLINEMQLNKVSKLVQDAVDKGAKVVKGGTQLSDLGKLFYAPTILTDIKPEMTCYREEIFGPVVQVIPFDTEEEAVSTANDTKSGLAGYFYTGDLAQAWRVAKELEVGMVGINEGMISCAEAAFGGVKESGIGREGSHYGIDEFVNVKYMCFGGLQ